jgi:hypothetical protein
MVFLCYIFYFSLVCDQVTLLHSFTKFSSTNLANDLIKLEITDTHKLKTFDIKDLYVNIPILETLNIAQKKNDKEQGPQKTQQIIKLLKVILEQNYLTFQQQIFKPAQGVAMGSPISGLIAELFLQQSEETHLKHILESKKIIYYARYVDDILIIYDSAKINTGHRHIHQQHSQQHKTHQHAQRSMLH